MKRIEICGNIASGKTTLARGLSKKGFLAIEENFEKHPFLADFYINQTYFAFETELLFALQHYHDIKKAPTDRDLVCDYSLYLDRAYADVTLNKNKHIFNDRCRNRI